MYIISHHLDGAQCDVASLDTLPATSGVKLMNSHVDRHAQVAAGRAGQVCNPPVF